MLDIRLIREKPDFVKEELAKVGFEAARIDALLEADRERRRVISEVETLKAQRGAVSKEIGKLSAEERAPRVAEMRAVGDRIGELEKLLAERESQFETLMLEVPNIPHPDVHVGPDDTANLVVREVGRRSTSTSRRARTGTSAPSSTSSTSSAA